MFDKLVITEPQGALFQDRKKYFLLSGLALSTILSTALVVSLFAVDLDLGTDDFDLVELMAPVEMPQVEPPLPQPKREQPRLQTAQDTPVKVPTRQVNMARVDEVPREVPATVSTAPNTQKERPADRYFEVGKIDSDPAPSGESGRTTGEGAPGGTGIAVPETTVAVVKEEEPPPPPVKTPTPAPKKPATQSMGVLNGKATSLPKPNYPAAAKAVNAAGQVSVQILIDENGNVVSANAVSGHPLLKASAEAAARNARFSPTMLSGEPIKIKGVIIYNFNT
ncbi:MAG: TonB family protein [Pyrinomonadaceae bacterium]